MANQNIDVMKDVKKIMKQDIYKIMKETSKVSRDAIDMFYSDYSPEEYHRVFGLKNLFDVDLQEIKNGYILKYTYSFSHVMGHKKPSVIFYGPFMQGYHGGPIFVVDGYDYDDKGRQVISDYHYDPAPQMVPSPWDIIEEFAENIGGVIH